MRNHSKLSSYINTTFYETRLLKTLIVSIAVAVIIVLFSSGISGNDFWWHLKVGELIIDNGFAVPTTDSFSWHNTTIPWTAHEWLSEVLFAIIYRAAGELGIFCLSISAAILMMGLLWNESKQYFEKNPILTSIIFILSCIIFFGFFYGRPHIFSFFLFFVQLKILYGFYNNNHTKTIWFIPLIACLWSNLHGGYASLSYILCIIFLAVSSININIGCISSERRSKQTIITLAIVTICSIAAILINPVGINVLLYPYRSFADTLMMSFIEEWRSPDAKLVSELILYFLPVALMLIGFFAEKKKIHLIDLVIMGLLVFLFLRSIRFIMLWYIGIPFCAIKYIPENKLQSTPTSSRKNKIIRCLLALLILIALIVTSFGIYHIYNNNTDLIDTTMSEEAIMVIKEDAPQRIFNDYNVGDMLIYNNIPVFFDARADLYAHDNILTDGVSIMFLNASFEDMLEKYDFDAILICKNRPLYQYIVSHPEQFVCVYEDDDLSYFRVQ